MQLQLGVKQRSGANAVRTSCVERGNPDDSALRLSKRRALNSAVYMHQLTVSINANHYSSSSPRLQQLNTRDYSRDNDGSTFGAAVSAYLGRRQIWAKRLGCTSDLEETVQFPHTR